VRFTTEATIVVLTSEEIGITYLAMGVLQKSEAKMEYTVVSTMEDKKNHATGT
jgi:hypothetical protein